MLGGPRRAVKASSIPPRGFDWRARLLAESAGVARAAAGAVAAGKLTVDGQTVRGHCGVCHSYQLVEAQRLDRANWEWVMDDMIGRYGATWISPPLREAIVDYLVERGAKIDVAERGGLTPVDAALGKAGGHGRGSTIEVYEDTAARLRELCAEQDDCDLSQPDGPP